MTSRKPTPSTAQFAKYIRNVVKPKLYATASRSLANQLLTLLNYLEQERYDFSSDRAYQTRPICIQELAEYFEVTKRSVQRWLAALEALGFAQRIFRKDPRSAYKNRFSRIEFPTFKLWFVKIAEDANDTACRPTKKDNLQLSINPKISELPKQDDQIAFPASGGVTYYPVWIAIARKNLPTFNTPCTSIVASRFRTNLAHYGIPLNHPSVQKRWANFCKRAQPVGR